MKLVSLLTKGALAVFALRLLARQIDKRNKNPDISNQIKSWEEEGGSLPGTDTVAAAAADQRLP